jgi:hypothetical protein
MPLQHPRPHALLGRLANAWEDRRRDRGLERQLADFGTPSDRLELEAVLERHGDEEAGPIRAILRAQDAARLARRGGGTG